MRTIVLAAAALILASLVSAQAIGTTQSEARALEDRWQNCSQVIHGRLGALHPAEGDVSDAFITTYTFWARYNVTGVKGVISSTLFRAQLQYSPCVAPFVVLRSLEPEVYQLNNVFDDYKPTSNDKIVQFSMPETSDEKPKFVGTYTSTEAADAVVQVTTMCGDANFDLANVTFVNGFSTQFYIYSEQACPRFPYTNKAMPPGGIAALIIVLLCFVIQSGICVWYHKTHAQDSPFTTAEDQYRTVE